jgi:hypothetical protein
MFNMKIKHFITAGITACTLFAFAMPAAAQVTAADQERIIEIFKDVDPSQYRLVFDGGRKTIGERQIRMEDLRRVSKSTSPERAGVKWTFIVGDRSANEVFYIYTEGMSKMASLLGQKKFQALQEIAAKYEDAPER